MNQGEDGGGSPDSKGQGEHGSGREYGRHPELPEGIAQIAEEVSHDTLLLHAVRKRPQLSSQVL
jgi:hypothetical protein